MTELNILPVIAIMISIASLAYTYFGLIIKIREDMSKDKDCIGREIADLRSKMSSLETKTELFWRCIEGRVVEMLKSYPTNLNKDVLLDKLSDNSLTLREAEELRTILGCELDKAVDKQFAYVLALGLIEQKIYDLRDLDVKVNIDNKP